MTTTPERFAPSLAMLQGWMAQTILDPSRLDATPHAAVFGALFGATGPILPRDGLFAYANGYPARILEALRDSFPAVEQVVGAEAFADVCRRYTKRRPPLDWNLNQAGARFALFLRDDHACATYPFLGDLAELEWRILEAFHAPGGSPIDPRSLAGWGAEDFAAARLSFRPGTGVISSPWPIREIWKERETPRDAIDVALDRGPDHLLVRRRDLEVRIDGITAVEASLLRSLLAGKALGDAIEELSHTGVAEDEVTRMFGRWMGLGIVASCAR